MSPSLRRLNGNEVITALTRCGFTEVARESHAKLRRIGSGDERQTMTVPIHTSLATGTLKSIVRQAARYLTEEEIIREFYTK